jgi:MBG domain (YGX type)
MKGQEFSIESLFGAKNCSFVKRLNREHHYIYGSAMPCGEDTMKIRKPLRSRAAHLALSLVLATVVSAANLCAAQAGDACSAPTTGHGALPVGSATGCGVIITITATGATISSPINGNPYDGDDDTLVGVVNNSGQYLTSITLTASTDIFGFDGDGPCNYAQYSDPGEGSTADCFNSPNPTANPGLDPYDYQGPDNTFTNISGAMTTGTVVFTTPIPSGGSTWFALEGPPSGISGLVVSSDTLTLTETGFGAGTVTDNSSPTMLINCAEAGEGVPQTGSCSASYAPDAVVTLTATPNPSAPNGGPSTFGGWGGACASSGTNLTCTLTMSSAQNVTASFVAPPATNPVIPSTCSGTNVTGTINYCPNNPNPITPQNPCTDPNGVQFTVSIPVVSPPTQGEACLALSVTATEVSGNGLCAAGGTGQSGTGPGSAFDCRFADFYNYGTDPATESTVTPLCYPYSNGNCMFYTLSLTGGGIPNSELYSGGVNWQVAFNKVFSPPLGSYWYGSSPSMLDDPGEDEIPPLPWGTDCSTPMTDDPGGPSGTYYCQFDNNITTFYQPGGGSFDPIGGKTKQGNDVVVAFLPTATGSGATQTPPATTAPAISGNCINGCAPLGTASNGATITFAEGTGGTLQVQVTAGYPAPTLTAATTGTTTTAAESGSTVTLTTLTGTYGSQAVAGNTVAVSGCTPAAYDGTFAIASASGGTSLTYIDGTAGLAPGVGCQALVLPNGLTFNATTGLVGGTPADGTEGNYAVSFTANNGVPPTATLNYTLTVNPAGTLTITASSPSMTYGGTVPTITPSYMGFVNGDTPASLTTQPTCSTAATSSSPVGSSPTTSCSGAVDANYSTIKYVNGSMTVMPAQLTIIAGNGTMPYGGTSPTILPAFMGLVNGDNAATLGVTCTSNATSSSPVGNGYTSSCTASTGTNYTINYVRGTVTVTQAALTITASSSMMTYGGVVPTITPSYGGFVNGQNSSSLTAPPTCTTTATSASAPGGYPSSCTGAVDANYAITYVKGTVTVSALEISPASVNFGNLYLWQLSIQFVTITNKGTTPITISSIKTGAPGNALSEYGDISFCPPLIRSMPGTLPAGKSCVIGVGILPHLDIFSPTASTATLTITDSAAGSPHSALMTAMVTDPQVSLSSTNLSFGNQKTGTTSAAKKVTLTNSGLTSLKLTGLTIKPTANFALATGTTCTSSTMLSPGGTCLIYVTFTPTTRGQKYSGTVTITDLALIGTQIISLSGTGN